jgi:DNA-binding NtrC family response regulator
MPDPHTRERPLVLLIEEETSERAVLVEHLTEGGYEVIESSDSDHALAVLQSESGIRAVVTDAHVPGAIDGFELACRVCEQWPDIATIMTSGHSDPSSGPVPRGSEFIVKPYLLERLLPTLRRMLRPSG